MSHPERGVAGGITGNCQGKEEKSETKENKSWSEKNRAVGIQECNVQISSAFCKLTIVNIFTC